MAEVQTKIRRTSVGKFLQGIRDERKRAECHQVVKIMKRATKAEPKMWGTSIVGFGDCHFVYESGRTIDWFVAGFSPHAESLTLYITGSLDKTILKKLGKYKTGKNCLYIRTLEDVDQRVLSELIAKSAHRAQKNTN